MPEPQPATEEPEPDEDEVQERLDELDEAVERAEEGDVGAPGAEDSPFSGEQSAEDVDVDVAEIGVGEEVTDDEPSMGSTQSDFGSEPFGGGGPQDAAAGMEQMMAAAEDDDKLGETINEGFARLAVVGLDREYKMSDEDDTDALEHEFREVFETFRLGEYGSDALQEHVFAFDDTVDPMWGFFASMVVCCIIVVSHRPDGDELVMNMRQRLTGGFEQLRSD